MHSDDLWKSSRPWAILARIALAPLSLLYALGWEVYLWIYRLGIKTAYRCRLPVVCVGNLTVGGSGKTPITIHIVRLLERMGYRVVVSCSGYGGPRAEAASIAPDGPLDASEWGDEPAMLRWLCPDTPLIVGRRRPLAAQLAEERYPDAILVMDDGFQHLPLANDLSIILDAPNPTNRMCLPAGPYREGRWNRARCSLVIPSSFTIEKSRMRWYDESGDERAAPARANALCAIGDPSAFVADLRKEGVELVTIDAKPDHDPLSAGNLWAKLASSAPTVVTAKDWVKLGRRSDLADHETIVATQERSIEPSDEFAQWLRNRIDEIRKEKGAR